MTMVDPAHSLIAGHPEGEREHRVTLDDGRILAGLSYGVPEGVPVLYFHGYPGSRLEGRLGGEAARRHGQWLLALDRPGFGASTFKPSRTIAGWADDVREVADRLGLDRFSIVGASGGGPYALACAARMPERVRGVALVAGLGPLDVPGAMQGMEWQNRLGLGLARRAPPLARGLVSLAARVVRHHLERYMAFMLIGAPAVDRAVYDEPEYRSLMLMSAEEALRQGTRALGWELTLYARPWDFDLGRIPIPVHLWQGLADTIVPPVMMEQLQALLPQAVPHVHPNEGHLSLIAHYLDDVLATLRT